MAEGTRDWLETWEALRFEAEEYRELDNERVLTLHRYSGRGKTSRLELSRVAADGVGLFHIRGGVVIRLVHYMDRDRALADLGLEPEADSA
jgi:hypothetical protein